MGPRRRLGAADPLWIARYRSGGRLRRRGHVPIASPRHFAKAGSSSGSRNRRMAAGPIDRPIGTLRAGPAPADIPGLALRVGRCARHLSERSDHYRRALGRCRNARTRRYRARHCDRGQQPGPARGGRASEGYIRHRADRAGQFRNARLVADRLSRLVDRAHRAACRRGSLPARLAAQQWLRA